MLKYLNLHQTCVAALLLLITPLSHAQIARAPDRPLAAQVIVPQVRSYVLDAGQPIEISTIHVKATVTEQVATTTMDIYLKNPNANAAEAELIVPVPDGAVVRGFAFEGQAAEPVTEVLSADEARRVYERVVAKLRDPALLEFAGRNLIRSSVFPIPAGGSQRVRLTYEHLLPRDGDRIDYVLPRSEVLDYDVPWKMSVEVESKTPISTVYSPSHAIDTRRHAPGTVSVRTTPEAAREPGAFRLSYLLQREGVSASLLAYPDPATGGGYFLLLAGLPAPSTHDKPPIRRETTLVIDHSGSMSGHKIEQAQAAARQVLAGIDDGESFNIIAYNDTVTPFATKPVVKNETTERDAQAFLRQLRAGGGTNLHDALLTALDGPSTPGTLPLVLFLTDGLPTVGETSEIAIRNLARDHNPAHRRVFTFGVGADVNTPLLEKIATLTRATPTFVLPQEDVEVKVSQVFRRLTGPILTNPVLCENSAVPPAGTRLRDVMPVNLPDLFDGDQLVVLGRYVGNQPLHFAISGDYLGHRRTFRFTFPLNLATTRNAFVPRLWASRRIAYLIDTIREMGADTGHPGALAAAAQDPALAELSEEVIRLSTKFGILTEYTAFLAREGTELGDHDAILAQTVDNFRHRAMGTRTGIASMNQGFNNTAQRVQQRLNADNRFYDKNMNQVAITTVQQINDRAFFRRGNRWVDSRALRQRQPDRVLRFGTADFQKLVDRLVSEGRQGTIALHGEILLVVGGETVLVTVADSTP